MRFSCLTILFNSVVDYIKESNDKPMEYLKIKRKPYLSQLHFEDFDKISSFREIKRLLYYQGQINHHILYKFNMFNRHIGT